MMLLLTTSGDFTQTKILTKIRRLGIAQKLAGFVGNFKFLAFERIADEESSGKQVKGWR